MIYLKKLLNIIKYDVMGLIISVLLLFLILFITLTKNNKIEKIKNQKTISTYEKSNGTFGGYLE